MSQDLKEINTVEQWKWSEMQGLELLSSPPQQNSGKEEGKEEKAMEDPDSGSKVKDAASVANKEKDNGPNPVGFKELFRFADGLECVLMMIGSVGAFVHGCALPLFLRFFADLVNSLGSYANDPDKMMQEVLKVMNCINLKMLFTFGYECLSETFLDLFGSWVVDNLLLILVSD